MFAGAVISIIVLIITLLTMDSLRDSVRRSNPKFTPTQVHDAVNFLVTGTVIYLAISTVLWILLAFMSRAGKNWARIVSSVLFGLYTLLLLLSLARGGVAAGGLPSIVIWLIGLGSLIFLWRRDSTEYIKAPGTQ